VNEIVMTELEIEQVASVMYEIIVQLATADKSKVEGVKITLYPL
jgi:hypothetical protein